MHFEGYTTKERIYEGTKFTIHRADKSADEKSYILKVLDKRQSEADILAHLKNEYDLLNSIDSPFVIKTFGFLKNKDNFTLVLEDIGGHNLKALLTNDKPCLDKAIKLAIKIVSGIGDIHKRNIVHKDINPANIIYNEKTEELRIIDLHISSKFNLHTKTVAHPNNLEGTLSYIAPEQTGRTSRHTDSRSDLYSLGVTFYQLISGRLPFESDDQMQIIHGHLAKKHVPLTEIVADVPEIISRIVDKLLSKNPDDRYQTANGLKYDLERCLEAVRKSPTEPDFSEINIAENDYSGVLEIPEKLYGREHEIKRLHEFFDRTCEGSRELLLISGQPGTGKSVLIDEISSKVFVRKGSLIKGKFEKINKETPYSAFIQSFKKFAQLIGSEPESILAKWKSCINKALGDTGGILTALVPEMELIIGKQTEVAEVDIFNNQNRFMYVLQQFIKAISHKNHPLVLFLDDLHNADDASVELIKALVLDKQNSYFMFVGAYQTGFEAIANLTEQFEKEHIWIDRINLENLNMDIVNDLLKDALHLDHDCLELTKLVHQKTSGNAYFVRQFLKNLYEEEQIIFDFDNRKWNYDIKKLNNLEITDNVIDLVKQKIERLPSDVKETLSVASCFGISFKPKFLNCDACDNSESIKQHLEVALANNIIYPTDGGDYFFAHNHIRQVMYDLLPDDIKSKIHYRIGKRMWEITEGKFNDDILFKIVNHYNLGIKHIATDQEKLRLATLNLSAGRKAKSTAAYDSAFNYLNTASQFFKDSNWEKDYQLTLNIYSELAEASRLSNNSEVAAQSIEYVLKNAKTPLDKLKVYEIKIFDFNSLGKYQEALNLGLEVLKEFGLEMKSNPSKFQLFKTVFSIKIKFRKKCIDDFITMPEMEDENARAMMLILSHLSSSSFFVAKKLMLIIAYEQIKLTLKYGTSVHSAFALQTVAMAVAIALHKYEMAVKIGDFAMNLLKKFPETSVKSSMLFTYYTFIHHWKFSSRVLPEKMLDVYKLGYENGNIEYGEYGLTTYFPIQFALGMPLTEIQKEYGLHQAEISNLQSKIQIINTKIIKQALDILTGDKITEVTTLTGKYFGENEEITNNANLSVYYYYLLWLNYIFGKYAEAEKYVEKVIDLSKEFRGSFLYKQQIYFLTLTRLATHKKKVKHERKNCMFLISKDIACIKQWAKLAPMNHLHQFYLVKAERFRVFNRPKEARQYFDRAIVAARDNGFLLDEALACELAGKFLMTQNMDDFARHYLHDAYDLYLKWQGFAKLKQMEETYPQFVNYFNRIKQEKTVTTTSSTSTSRSGLDMGTLIKASQTLSGEMKIDSLLGKMMKIIVENSGAQSGALIGQAYLSKKNKDTKELILIGRGGNGRNERIDLPLSQTDKVPVNLVNYVARSGQPLIFENISKDKKYTDDIYVKQENPKSVLCLPIKSKNELLGLIYLENNLAEGIFTPQRLEVLNMLTSQIAISIENAMLYENMEAKVKQRTEEVVKQKEEIELKKDEIEQKNISITDSINYASRIQNAVLPPLTAMQEYLNDVFVLFKPRDIVSGDFYWFKKVEHTTGTKYIIVAADCTGHGVPGAFVSMLGLTFLNEITSRYEDETEINAATLLDKLRDKVKKSLGQDGTDGEQKDGMDLALCILDTNTKELHFAGAHNPLYIIRQETNDFANTVGIKQVTDNGFQLTQIKADSQPIGIYLKERPFTNKVINLKKDDKLYIFSDGYIDQVGGIKGKKFLSKNFKNLLLQIHQKPMTEQKQILEQNIEKWKGNLEQIDDILVVGFGI